MMEPLVINAPAVDAWLGRLAAERGGEHLARDRANLAKEFIGRAVRDVYTKLVMGGGKVLLFPASFFFGITSHPVSV